MIRIPGIRTGVEVLGDQPDALVDIDPGLWGLHENALIAEGIEPAGTLFHNPDLWPHRILAPDSNRVLGQLMLTNPKPDRLNRLVTATRMSAGEVVAEFYGGFAPGTETWLWTDPPWPEAFRLRSAEYPTKALAPGTNSFTYPMGVFDTAATPAAPTHPSDWPAWGIYNDADPCAVGMLITSPDGGVQLWYARTAFLVYRLIPPNPAGVWRFLPATRADRAATYVPLLLLEL